jgi:hypothetical protein
VAAVERLVPDAVEAEDVEDLDRRRDVLPRDLDLRLWEGGALSDPAVLEGDLRRARGGVVRMSLSSQPRSSPSAPRRERSRSCAASSKRARISISMAMVWFLSWGGVLTGTGEVILGCPGKGEGAVLPASR